MMMVVSVNGKITKGDNPDVRAWSSNEDAALFEATKKRYSLIIMGRKTYEAARPRIQLRPGTLRIVITKNPDVFMNELVSGQLEFTNESPRELVNRLGKAGYRHALLTGGSEINALFLREQLVDEIHLTIEPLIMTGSDLVSPLVTGSHPVNVQLKLESLKKLNDRGTLHLVYTVIQ